MLGQSHVRKSKLQTSSRQRQRRGQKKDDDFERDDLGYSLDSISLDHTKSVSKLKAIEDFKQMPSISDDGYLSLEIGEA